MQYVGQLATKDLAADAVQQKVNAEVRQHEQFGDFLDRFQRRADKVALIVEYPNETVRRVQQEKRARDE